jgi:hypothetical protein
MKSAHVEGREPGHDVADHARYRLGMRPAHRTPEDLVLREEPRDGGTPAMASVATSMVANVTGM